MWEATGLDMTKKYQFRNDAAFTFWIPVGIMDSSST